jgi:sigma-E factor negative regulatory protein RseC
MNGVDMTKTGRVVAVEGHLAKISVEAVSSECRSCATRSFCHGPDGSRKTLTAVNQASACVGETVTFDVNAGRVVLAAFLIWIVPVLAMILGYALGTYLGKTAAMIMAFGFLAASYLVLKFVNKAASGGTSFYPVITGVVEDGPGHCS